MEELLRSPFLLEDVGSAKTDIADVPSFLCNDVRLEKNAGKSINARIANNPNTPLSHILDTYSIVIRACQ